MLLIQTVWFKKKTIFLKINIIQFPLLSYNSISELFLKLYEGLGKWKKATSPHRQLFFPFVHVVRLSWKLAFNLIIYLKHFLTLHTLYTNTSFNITDAKTPFNFIYFYRFPTIWVNLHKPKLLILQFHTPKLLIIQFDTSNSIEKCYSYKQSGLKKTVFF